MRGVLKYPQNIPQTQKEAGSKGTITVILFSIFLSRFQDALHEFVMGSMYSSHYFNVINHKAMQMCQSSKPDEIIRTEFSGTPIRGRKGGLSFGPQETLALSGIGCERLSCEISHMRSDFTGVEVNPVCDNEESEILGISSTCARVIDDLNLGKNNFLFKVTKHVTASESK